MLEKDYGNKEDRMPMLNRQNHAKWQECLYKRWKKNNEVYHVLTTKQEAVFEFPELNLPIGADGRELRRAIYAGDAGLFKWKKDYDKVDAIKTYFDTQARPKCMSDIMQYMDSEIGNQISGIADYAARVQNNDIIWMLGRAEFVATGHGGASIAMDAIAHSKVELKGFTHKDYVDFCKAESDARKRLLGRDPDPAVILAAILDSGWIMSLKNHPMLKDKIRMIFELAVWPTTAVQAPIFANYLTTVEAAEGAGSDSYGQLKAHLAVEDAKTNLSMHLKEADKWYEVIEAHQIEIDESENVLALYTKTAGKGKRFTAGKAGGPFISKDLVDKICFKCGMKGHLYKDCTSRTTPKCSKCAEQHHTNVHEIVQDLKARRTRRGTPWTAPVRGDIEGNLCSSSDLLEAYEGMMMDDLDNEQDIEAMAAAMQQYNH